MEQCGTLEGNVPRGTRSGWKINKTVRVCGVLLRSFQPDRARSFNLSSFFPGVLLTRLSRDARLLPALIVTLLVWSSCSQVSIEVHAPSLYHPRSSSRSSRSPQRRIAARKPVGANGPPTLRKKYDYELEQMILSSSSPPERIAEMIAVWIPG